MTTDAVGGVWTYTLDLAAGLAAAGLRVRIAVLGPALQTDQRTDLDRRGLEAVELPVPLEWLAADAAAVQDAARAVAAVARAWRADLVHLHTPAFASTLFACPIVVTNHSCVATWWAAVRSGHLPADLSWRAAIVRAGLERADLVLAPTAAYACAVRETYGLSFVPFAIHNGRAAPAASDLIQDGCDEVFTAGRLWDEGKNLAALDRAAARLLWPVRAAGAGAGPDGSRVTFQNIEMLGRQSEVEMRRRLARRPIYVAPARFEPFGLAVLEAAQAGCALVLNDIATFRELWTGAALFVDADDGVALAAAIRSLIDDRVARRSLGNAAREHAANYTVEKSVGETVAAYTRCLEPTRSAALSA